MSLAHGEDLANSFPEGFDLMLQNRKIFEDAHASSELGNTFFPLAQATDTNSATVL